MTTHLFFDYGGFVESVISYRCCSENVTVAKNKKPNITTSYKTEANID